MFFIIIIEYRKNKHPRQAQFAGLSALFPIYPASIQTPNREVIHGQLLNQEIQASNVTGVTKPGGLIASTEQSI